MAAAVLVLLVIVIISLIVLVVIWYWKMETPRLKDCRLVMELRLSWFLGSLVTPYLL